MPRKHYYHHYFPRAVSAVYAREKQLHLSMNKRLTLSHAVAPFRRITFGRLGVWPTQRLADSVLG